MPHNQLEVTPTLVEPRLTEPDDALDERTEALVTGIVAFMESGEAADGL